MRRRPLGQHRRRQRTTPAWPPARPLDGGLASRFRPRGRSGAAWRTRTSWRRTTPCDAQHAAHATQPLAWPPSWSSARGASQHSWTHLLERLLRAPSHRQPQIQTLMATSCHSAAQPFHTMHTGRPNPTTCSAVASVAHHTQHKVQHTAPGSVRVQTKITRAW